MYESPKHLRKSLPYQIKFWWMCFVKLAFKLYHRQPAPPFIHCYILRALFLWHTGLISCPFFMLNLKHNLCWRKPTPADIYIHLLAALFTNVTSCLCKVYITQFTDALHSMNSCQLLIAKKCVYVLLPSNATEYNTLLNHYCECQ